MHIELTDRKIGSEEALRMLSTDAAGAAVTFSGIVRPLEGGASIEKLHYEHYPGMAEKTIRGIVEEAVAAHGLTDAVVIHRIGDVPAGEESVVVAVSAGHRREAFEGCSQIMDRIKSEVPIWKKDIGERTQWQSERK